jgi:hypothetical protein
MLRIRPHRLPFVQSPVSVYHILACSTWNPSFIFKIDLEDEGHTNLDVAPLLSSKSDRLSEERVAANPIRAGPGCSGNFRQPWLYAKFAHCWWTAWCSRGWPWANFSSCEYAQYYTATVVIIALCQPHQR